MYGVMLGQCWGNVGAMLQAVSQHEPLKRRIFLMKTLKTKGCFSILKHQSCLSQLFLVHLNTYLMSLRPSEIFLPLKSLLFHKIMSLRC